MPYSNTSHSEFAKQYIGFVAQKCKDCNMKGLLQSFNLKEKPENQTKQTPDGRRKTKKGFVRKKGLLLFLELNPEQQNQFWFLPLGQETMFGLTTILRLLKPYQIWG